MIWWIGVGYFISFVVAWTITGRCITAINNRYEKAANEKYKSLIASGTSKSIASDKSWYRKYDPLLNGFWPALVWPLALIGAVGYGVFLVGQKTFASGNVRKFLTGEEKKVKTGGYYARG